MTLLEGPVFVAGALTGLAVEMLTVPERRRATAAVAVALLGSGLVGGYDDLYGATRTKGFAGHLRALRGGELTSGMIKIAGVGFSSLAAALIAGSPPEGRSRGRVRPGAARGTAVGTAVDVVLNTALTASSANLINLLDLRPGRAIKGGLLFGAKLGIIVRFQHLGSAGRAEGASIAGPVLAAALGALPSDLAGRSMLGDCGANALGAGVAAAATGLPRSVRVVVLLVSAGLNLLSERYSFTALIEANPLLRAIDRLGRPR